MEVPSPSFKILPHVCIFCEKVFSKHCYLNKHYRSIHSMEEKNIRSYSYETFNSKCLEGCEISFKFIADLRYHLTKVHDIQCEKEEIEFNTKKEFEVWKNNLQARENVEYVFARGTKQKRTHTDIEKTYFNCNRSGKYTNTVDDNKRKRYLKIRKSCKINKACTSQIFLTKMDNIYKVIFYKNHYGHYLDSKYLHLQLEDRKVIAEKLKCGVPVNEIINSCHNSFDGTELKRVNLVSKKDIFNVKRAYDIKTDASFFKPDSKTIEMLVYEFMQLEQNPIIFYKEKLLENLESRLNKEDFCLIIMSQAQQKMLSTFGSNIIAIDSTLTSDFELTTILVLDEFGDGFPVACLLSNRKDNIVMELFLKEIQSKVEKISAEIFISKKKHVLYKAWESVMGPVKNLIYCSWPFIRSWQKTLGKEQWILNFVKDIDLLEVNKPRTNEPFAIKLPEEVQEYLSTLSSPSTSGKLNRAQCEILKEEILSEIFQLQSNLTLDLKPVTDNEILQQILEDIKRANSLLVNTNCSNNPPLLSNKEDNNENITNDIFHLNQEEDEINDEENETICEETKFEKEKNCEILLTCDH